MRATLMPRPEWIGRIALILVASITAVASAQEEEADALSTRFREAAQKVLPAVVSVRTAGGPEIIRPGGPPPGVLPVLPGMPFPDQPPISPEASGLVIDAEKGTILTTNHAIGDPGTVEVVLPDGRRRNAAEVARDPRSDLAVLTIDPAGLDLAAAEWGDSDALQTGDHVLAIGHPLGLEGTVTSGIVSGKGRSINPGQYEDLIQTDAAMYPGSSGGPLVDLQGRVVGIATAVQGQGGRHARISFAIPATRARRIAEDLADSGRVHRSYLGVRIDAPDPQAIAEHGRRAGVEVTAVGTGSPASTAGLQVGDTILRAGDRPIASPGELQAIVEFAPIDEPLSLTIQRGDEEQTIEVKPAALPDEAAFPEAEPERRGLLPRPRFERRFRPRLPEESKSENFPDLGFRLAEPTRALAGRFGGDRTSKGVVVVSVERGSPADRGGIEPGMRILALGDTEVADLPAATQALKDRDPDSDLVIHVRQGSQDGYRVLLAKPEPEGEPNPD